MQNKQDIIDFTSEDGSIISFSVLEQVKIAGVSYILVTDNYENEEEENAFILKEICEEDGQSVYEIVEDEYELDAIAKVFEEILDDVDIKM